jgi:hypothetical protein
MSKDTLARRIRARAASRASYALPPVVVAELPPVAMPTLAELIAARKREEA